MCKLYKKPLPRPAVSIPKFLNFNEIVAMYLHQLDENLWYLYFIHELSGLVKSLSKVNNQIF